MWKVVTVIPTFNRKDYLAQVLSDLRVQEVENVEFKTVVVVDGSNDGTQEMLSSKFPEVDVVEGRWLLVVHTQYERRVSACSGYAS